MKIDFLRKEVAKVDREMLELFEKRMALVRKIGDEKAAEGLPFEDKEVETGVIETLEHMASPDVDQYVPEVWGVLFDVSKRHQEFYCGK